MQVRIAIAIEPDQGRWVAYGANDTPEHEILATVREIIAGHPATMWLEVQVPEQQPATVPALIVLHWCRPSVKRAATALETRRRTL